MDPHSIAYAVSRTVEDDREKRRNEVLKEQNGYRLLRWGGFEGELKQPVASGLVAGSDLVCASIAV